jgi:hypothetical protein
MVEGIRYFNIKDGRFTISEKIVAYIPYDKHKVENAVENTARVCRFWLGLAGIGAPSVIWIMVSRKSRELCGSFRDSRLL